MNRPNPVSDEALKRMNMPRERFDEMRSAMRKREERSPDVGDAAPDFELPMLGGRDERVRLSDFSGRCPVALIFGSYT